MREKSNKRSEAFEKAIAPIIDKMIEKKLADRPYHWVGTVKVVAGTIPNQTADVELGIDKGSGITRNGLKNKSGENLSVNDEVYVISPNGKSLTNAWIHTKK